MCGIYLTNIPFEKSKVIEKLNLIEYRGPDNLGYEKINKISLGHLRLSILDLDTRSNQPYRYKNLSIVFNGEIYNFKDIRNELSEIGYQFETESDTEVLIIGYQEWGKQILAKLNGMFAFAIYDIEKHKIFAARDRVGVKPFYYYWKDGEFEICSQLGPLISKNSKVSDEAVSIYLDCGYVPSPFSILKDVYKLSPGNYMEIDIESKSFNIIEYWNLKKVEHKNSISYEEAKRELHELLKDAVKIRMQSDVPIGAFLSGGIDSALVASLASKLSDNPIQTYTIGFEDKNYDESKVAEEYSKIIGSRHTKTKCRPNEILELLPKFFQVFDEPFADSSALPTLLLNSVTKENVTVALSGDGGDESFLGYIHFDLINKFEKIQFVPHLLRRFLARIPWYKIFGGRPETISEILSSKNSDELAYKIFTGFSSVHKNKNNSWLKYYEQYKKLSHSPKQRAADLNIKLWLENDSNVKVDRGSMAYSVEVRSPFLDYRIIEFARSLPINYRYNKGSKKKILKDILKEYIPQDVFNQPKKGFAIPLGKWIREDLRDDVLKELNDKFLRTVSNLDIEKFKEQLNKHLLGKNDYSINIWRLYVLAKWYKKVNINDLAKGN
ncbi:asparagine synthase (glutamine-hydrolyzing) [Pontibacter vulgaris]|uniref:asparagine synthase (glutamine-hydrolyzing) n=1 Tax=Pontibacter vulgaris TaxID=2905679 RepID=UPI001FA6BD52|nr:asparagine synthase (glutamine-hydrolyzing) [Pontibacter vulgaris]